MNLNPVNKGIEHGVGHFPAVPVFLYQCDKPFRFHLFHFFLLHLLLQFPDTPFKEDLLLVILLDHTLNLTLRQQAFHGTFIQVLYHAVQLLHPLPGFLQFLLSCAGLL